PGKTENKDTGLLATSVSGLCCVSNWTLLPPDKNNDVVHHDYVLTVTLFGTFITQSLERSWNLWRERSSCRVPNAGRYYFDFTHWNVLASWVIIITELVVGTIPDPPWMRMLAVPVPSIFFIFGLEMLIFEILYIFEIPAPFRISSIPKGSPMRPALYPLLEDIIAVDGKGGSKFRDRLDQRYKASPPFRGMLHRVTMLWAVPQVLVAGGTLAGIVIADHELAYTLGWSVPAIWAAIWIVGTVIWIRVELRRERNHWRGVRLTQQLQGAKDCDPRTAITIEEAT
ncbi:hypothetical protein N7508_006376, partial [Penicillium antarcticum]|uniref:uncharacterized protein n=1 Tax=Penicillium antarcticum TaxID=416450 RepID=UPI00238F757C